MALPAIPLEYLPVAQSVSLVFLPPAELASAERRFESQRDRQKEPGYRRAGPWRAQRPAMIGAVSFLPRTRSENEAWPVLPSPLAIAKIDQQEPTKVLRLFRVLLGVALPSGKESHEAQLEWPVLILRRYRRAALFGL